MKGDFMRTKLLLVLALSCWAGMSAANELIPMAPAGGNGTAPDSNRDAIWCQMPDYWGVLASQIDYVYPFDAGAIDDFMVGADALVTSIEWWGLYWNGTPGGPADYFVVSVYEDNGECYPMADPFYAEDIMEYSEDADGDGFVYAAEIPPVEIAAGVAYWIEIQAVMEFTIGGQWGWVTSDEVNLCPPMQGFPLLDIPYWSNTETAALAFCLYSEVVANEVQAWGNVKALYR